jgi:hypothetical protein
VVTKGTHLNQSVDIRQRIRVFARTRLAEWAGDAYLAEVWRPNPTTRDVAGTAKQAWICSGRLLRGYTSIHGGLAGAPGRTAPRLADVGALLWIASYVILTGLIEPRTALVMSTGAVVGTGVVAFMWAGDVRARVRVMRATVMFGYPDPLSQDARRKLRALADTLIEADRRRQLGLLSPVEYEMTWWRVYDQIAPDHSRPHRTHW